MRQRLAAGLLICVAGTASAQIIPRLPGGGQRQQLTPRDTSRRDSLVKWLPADSAMAALLARQGYTITRYQGDTATFDPRSKVLDLKAGRLGKAAVQRGQQMFTSDSGIFYDDSLKKATLGGHYVLSDPSSGNSDVVGFGQATYDIARRTARVPRGQFEANMGQIWRLSWEDALVIIDSAGKQPTTLAKGGSLTSCTDSIPDYHFEYGEVKRTGTNTIVARPAILYIRDIPVLYLPFIFSDNRPGRHSGILAPRFGVGDIVRNSPTYRRNVENIGYYFALSEYFDASAWLDWRSAAGATQIDPGWMRYNVEFQYRWLDRFLSGRLATSHTAQNDQSSNTAISWNHQQEFSRNARLNTNFNYVTSTRLQRQNTFDPYSVLATISSSASYQQKLGPMSLSLGGTQKQYPGRDQRDQTFPTLSITSPAIRVADWLSWTPNLNYTSSRSLNLDQPGTFQYRYVTGANGQRDSVLNKRNSFTSSASFDTPITIFGYDLRNSFRMNQMRNDFPEQFTLYDVKTGEVIGNRVFSSTFRTDLDWTPDFQLPPILRNVFNITPSVGLANVDPGPFWVKTERSGGKFVAQAKRLTFGLSASPQIYGLFPGFGAFSAFRHSLTPTLGYTYAPAKEVGDAYLQALGRSRKGYLGSARQNALSLGLSTTLEAKVKPHTDTSDAGNPVRLVSINFNSLSFDFDRLHNDSSTNRHWWRGLTTETFGYSLRSDFLPGFDFSSSYSLFQGSTLSDTAVFKPYLTNISASFNISQMENPFAVFTRLFGKAVPEAQHAPVPGTDQVRPRPDDQYTHQLAAQPVAGQGAGRGQRYIVPPTQGWRASFTFSTSRPRPPVGGNIIDFDPRLRCQQLSQGNPFLFEACLAQLRAQPTTQTPVQSGTVGGPAYRIPPTTTLGANVNFNLTDKWTTAWQTNYDFERHEFASHVVQLQRDIHDWRAIFAFTQSPNGNFAFNFSIALKAEPDLKFDYNRATVRSGQTF